MNGSGTSRLTLAAANSYTGPTQVNGGTLRISGSLATASAVTIGGTSASGAPTLTGSGSIPGSVTIASGNSGAAGHLAPSGIAGATTNMNLSGGLTLADGASTGTGAVLDFNLVSPGNGDLVTTSNLYLGTNGVLNINPFNSPSNPVELATGYYPLINFSSLTSADNSATWSVGNTGGDSGHTYSFVIVGGDQVDLHVTTGTVYGSSSWVLNSSGGSYGNSANWLNQTVPNGAGQTATFVNSSVTALMQTVMIDSTYTVGAIDFTSGTTFKLLSSGSGPGYSLTLNNNGAGAQVNLTNSSMTLRTSLVLADGSGVTTVNVDPNSSLFVVSYNGTDPAISGSGQAIKFAGGGMIELGSPNSYSGGTTVAGGMVQVDAGATLGTGPVNVTGGLLDVSSSGPISVGPLTVASGGTLNIALGNLVTSAGAASFAGTLNISGSPSGNLDKLIVYSGSPTGMFASATSFTGYALVYSPGELDLQSYSSFNNTPGNTTTVSSGVDLNGGPLMIDGGGSTVFNGPVQLDGATLTVSGSSVTINGAPTLNSGTIAVSSGTFTINNNTNSPATGTGPVTITISPAATVQLAGTSSALTAGVNIVNNGSAASQGGLHVTGANQVVGTISGAASGGGNTGNPTTYGGDTTVGDGTNATNLTATQILQNSLTINANSTVTILPSGSGGTMTASPSTSAAVAASSTDVAASDNASAGTSDPFTAIQQAIADGAISNTTGQVLENRVAAIERLAATDPGLDVSLLESRVLAVLPSSSSTAADSSPIVDSGSSLLAMDSSALGSGSNSASSGASAAFAPSASFTGSPAAVPEPSTLALAALAAIGLIVASRRRRFCCNEQ